VHSSGWQNQARPVSRLCIEENLKIHEQLSFIPRDHLKDEFFTDMELVCVIEPGIELCVPRGFEYVFTGKLRHDINVDAGVGPWDFGNDTRKPGQATGAIVERQRERD
jgi:hypothetical protein